MAHNILSQCVGFEWDEGNTDKNWIRHHVSRGECEEVFFNKSLTVADDRKRSTNQEIRFYALNRTDTDRFLFIVFTVRNSFIRMISARNMTAKERRRYYEEIKRSSKF